MKSGPRGWLSALLIASLCALIPPGRLFAQQDKVAALKQSLGENQKRLRQYKWIETTVVSLKGEDKSSIQKLCFYGPDGKVQKQQISAPAQQESPGGMKGKIAAKKKGEMTEYMKQAAGLVHQYVPPDSQRIQAVKAAGGLSVNPTGPGAAQIELRNYLKSGDTLSLNLDTASNSIQAINVNSYLESQKDDAITMSVTFARLGDGVSYPANIVLNAPAKKVQVKIQNSNYEKVAPQVQAPAQQTTGAPASSLSAQAIDQLTGPIALYPDPLIFQIVAASTNVDALKSFADWMGKNANLKGSELQDAAQKAGFDAALIALAPFPQVIQMMVQKPDWTKALGQAFTADKDAIFDSIQRLRAQAQATGNLKTTPQQKVETQTTSGGQQVIVVQPANPQVIYVPQYNPQTVYVAAPPPPPSGASVAGAAAIGFTAGVIIGGYHNSYYHAYDEYWDHREDYYQDRQENYQQNQDQRQSNAQANQSQRQSTSQANQSQRQSTSQANQAQRQSSASSAQSQAAGTQSQRQSSASSAQSQAAANQGQRQAGGSSAQSQATATSSRGSGQTASQRSGMSSGGLSGYQSGAATRTQSSRGSGSLSSSRGVGRSGGRSRGEGGRR